MLAESIVLLARRLSAISITHPCFDALTLLTVASMQRRGLAYAIPAGDYFLNRRGETTGWLLGAAPPDAKAGLPKFRALRFTRA